MGSHTNFYKLILDLLRIKSELKRIELPRLQPLIQLLQSKSIITTDEGEELIPSNNDLAQELGITTTKCNKLLKDLRDKLTFEFSFNPLKITNVIHEIMIWLPHDEQNKYFENKSTYFILCLPQMPRVGEKIELDFFETERFKRGVVHEITHRVDGQTQFVEIHVHPFKGIYHKWQKLKEAYERDKRWEKRLEKEQRQQG